MKIFIAGCGRSGTTMLRAQMRGLPDCHVVSTEEPFSHFDAVETEAENVVIKRDSGNHKKLQLLPPEIKLIYLVRHPYDVLTSHHPGAAKKRRFHVTIERWLKEFDGLERLEAAQPERDVLIVRYEDIVTDQTNAQRRMENWLGLNFSQPFGTVRRVVPNSLYRWRMNPDEVAYLQSLPPEVHERIRAFCQRFGYDPKIELAWNHHYLRLVRWARQKWLTRPQDVKWGES